MTAFPNIFCTLSHSFSRFFYAWTLTQACYKSGCGNKINRTSQSENKFNWGWSNSQKRMVKKKQNYQMKDWRLRFMTEQKFSSFFTSTWINYKLTQGFHQFWTKILDADERYDGASDKCWVLGAMCGGGDDSSDRQVKKNVRKYEKFQGWKDKIISRVLWQIKFWAKPQVNVILFNTFCSKSFQKKYI